MSDIQTSTIRVPKNVLEDIKIYCRKAGQPVGEWVEKAWNFLQKNDFDIYDTEATPSLPVPAEVERERNQVDALCKLMSEFIISQKQAQLPAPELIAHAAEEKQRQKPKTKNKKGRLPGCAPRTPLCRNIKKRHIESCAEYVTNKRL